MTISDEVTEAIDRDIAAHEPERGGLLFGPVGRDFVTLFIPDTTAATTAVTYQISAEMCTRAPQIEIETNLEYKGIVHSHPGSSAQPSTGDELSAARALEANPHLPKFFMPIVTCSSSPPDLSPHEHSVGRGMLSSYCAFRNRHRRKEQSVKVRREAVRVVPMRQHLRALCAQVATQGMQANIGERATTVFQDNVLQLAYVISLNGADVVILAGEDYPYFAPHVLLTEGSASTRLLPISWDIAIEPEKRLIKALQGTRLLVKVTDSTDTSESTLCLVNKSA